MPDVLRKALALSLLSWLVWQGSAATFLLIWAAGSPSRAQLERAFQGSEEQRILWTLAGRDRELELTPGYHQRLYRTLMAHLSPGDTLVAATDGDLRAAQVLAPLPALLFPRTIRPANQPDPARVAESDALYFLDFRERSRARCEGVLKRVATGHDWTLWR